MGLHAIKYLSILNACLFLEHFCNIRNLLDLAAVHMSYYCCLDTCNMQQEIFFVVELLCMFTAYISGCFVALFVPLYPTCSKPTPHPARASSLQQSRPRHYNFHRDLWLPDKTRSNTTQQHSHNNALNDSLKQATNGLICWRITLAQHPIAVGLDKGFSCKQRNPTIWWLYPRSYDGADDGADKNNNLDGVEAENNDYSNVLRPHKLWALITIVFK